MKRLVLTVVATVALLGWGAPAQATPITYELSAIASGQIGGTTFTNVEVDLIGRGDTTDVTSLFSGEIFGNPFSNFTATIAGVGTATITDPSEIWAIPTPSPGFLPVPGVVIGRIDSPPALDSITGIGIFASPLLAGYEDTTGIGPIADEGGIGFPTTCGTPFHDPCLHTTLGLLSFSSNFDIPPTTDDHATFVATVQPVPEPASLVLLGTGLLAVTSRLRRRRSTRNTAN